MTTSVSRLALNPDRFFDPDPAIRRVAREIHHETSQLPLICPHGHVDPRLLATNDPFPEPTALILQPDHYILRMLYSRGVGLEELGVPTRDGSPVESDPRRIWSTFAGCYYLFRGTPTGAWLDHELAEVFDDFGLSDGAFATRHQSIREVVVSVRYRHDQRRQFTVTPTRRGSPNCVYPADA